MALPKEYLYTSDGTGDAALMHVTNDRSIAATTLQVDTVVGVPAKFMATVGDVLPDGFLDPATVTKFYGKVSGGNLEIEGFFPGTPDIGNTQGQAVVIKPMTEWANLVAESFLSTLNGDGKMKFVFGETQPSPDPDGNIIIFFKKV